MEYRGDGKLIEYNRITPSLGPGCCLFDGASVIGDVVLGDACSVWFNTVIRGDVNQIRIGSKTNIQDLSMIHCTTAKYPTLIGDEVTIGHKAMIHGAIIDQRVLVGMGAIILDNAHIRENTIIGAGSLVLQNSDFPPNVLVVGSPARVKRELRQDEIDMFAWTADHYKHLADNYFEKGIYP